MGSNQASTIDTIMQLLALFKLLMRNKHPSTSIVFEAFIDNLYQQPQLLDDSFVRQLRRYPGFSLSLKNRCESLHVQLQECITENTEDELDDAKYNLIEDMWLDINKKLTVLHALDPKPYSESCDKYSLYAQIARASYEKLGENFNIDTFITGLSLAEVSLHERALIEVLPVIDDKAIQSKIIEKLESEPISCSDWKTKEFGGISIFIKAAGYGNTGLLRLLETNQPIKKQSLNTAILVAAKRAHWSTVSYLCEICPHKISRETLADVLSLAAQSGALRIVKQLCDGKNYPTPKIRIFEQALEAAVTNNHLPTVHWLFSSPYFKRSKNMSEKLFNLAIKLRHFPIATYFYNLPNAIAPHPMQINKAFRQAILNNDLETVRCLGNLITFRPRASLCAKGFVQAASLDLLPMLICLSHLPGYSITDKIIEDALIMASTNGHLAVAMHLLDEIGAPKAQQKAASISLLAATKAGKLDITQTICHNLTSSSLRSTIDSLLIWATKSNKPQAVELFCSLTVNKPRSRALSQALFEAIKIGKLNLVTSICQAFSPVPQRCINASIQSAVIHHRSEILAYLYELPENKPQPKFVRMLLNKANSHAQDNAASYLQSRLDNSKAEKGTGKKLETFGIFGPKQEGAILAKKAPIASLPV